MLKFLLLCVAISVVSCYTPSVQWMPVYKWPQKYTGHISKVCVMSGLVEEMDIWVTKKKSRVDYYNGAVKSIYCNKFGFRGTRYEIHPVTIEGTGEQTMSCNIIQEDRYDYTGKKTLPNLDGFYAMRGSRVIRGKKCTRLEKTEYKGTMFVNQSIWAYFNDKLKAYLPVKSEEVVYNTELGQVRRHNIIDYIDFRTKFNGKEVFSTKLWCGLKNAILHKQDDESVTKHLMFIDPENEKHVVHVFNAFKKLYNQSYADQREHALRKQVFQDNMRIIRSTNLKNLGYKLAVNHFADRLPEEMRKYTGRLARPKGDVGTHPFPFNEMELEEKMPKLPKSFDLRDEGFVTKVENQEQCGSCWTFGTTGAVEGALARKLGLEKQLAKQALLDCAWEFGAGGCDGGTDTAAYKMMIKYGMPTEAEYGTYAGQDGFCKIKNMTDTYKIRGFVDVTPNSISALKVALYEYGPLSVSVHATKAWLAYSNGIFYDFTCKNDLGNLNHEVTLVGYGEYAGEPFWVIKNSWGQVWGQGGFMQIAAKNNHCGLMSEPTYVLF